MILTQRCWFCGDLATEGPCDGMYACDRHWHFLDEDDKAS
jgi:hypothetical protein